MSPRSKSTNDFPHYCAAVAVGLLVWLVVVLATGRSAAWDAQSYWLVGYPIMGITVATLALLRPRWAWRWPITMMFAQMLLAVATNPDRHLLPLAIVVFLVLALPLMLPSLLAARLSPYRKHRRY